MSLSIFAATPALSVRLAGILLAGLSLGASNVGPSAGPVPAATWRLQAPWPTSDDLHGLAMVGPDEAWMVGSAPLGSGSGTVLHTADGGLTWQKTVLATSQINGVDFVDAQHGWIVGNDTFRTTDGGVTWVHLNAWGTLYGVHFVDTLHGWACGNGGVAYRTTDGGVTWSAQSIAGYTMRGIFFLDQALGWAVDIGGGIHHTTDGGLTWTTQYSDAGASNLGSVQFFDSQEGWAIGGDTFLHTLDGGTSWAPVPVPFGTWVHDAHFASRQVGVAVGEYGNVVRTTDGGLTWTTVFPQGGRPRLWRVQMWDELHGFFVGEAAMLYRTADGGQTWTSRQSGGWAMTHALDALRGPRVGPAQEGNLAWAACEGGEVLRTTNGGEFWERTTPPGVDTYGSIKDVSFANATTGYAILDNEFFGGYDYKIDRSTDGGQTWEIRQIFFDVLSLDRVVALDANTLLVSGTGIDGTGNLIRSTDGGVTWTHVPPIPGGIGNLDFVSATTGWLAGDRIFTTTNGGRSWTQQLDDGNGYLDVSFADARHGWAVGAGGRIVHTADGGQTWTVQPSGTAEALFAVSAVSATEAWAAVLTGKVIHTTDGGATWTMETIAADGLTNFEAILFTRPGAGYVAGNTGIWHRAP